MVKILSEEVDKLLLLSNLSLSDKEKETITENFISTVKLFESLKKIKNLKDITPTYQPIKLKNVFFEDGIGSRRTFSQSNALYNAKRKGNGFFKVNKILDK